MLFDLPVAGDPNSIAAFNARARLGSTTVAAFWSSAPGTCAGCSELSASIEAASARHPDVVFLRIDVAAAATDPQIRTIANFFSVSAVPTVVVIQNGRVVRKTEGEIDLSFLTARSTTTTASTTATSHATSGVVLEMPGPNLQTVGDLNALLAKFPTAVLEFVKPGCGACAQIAPYMDVFASEFPGTAFVRIQARASESTAAVQRHFEAYQGYPTFIYISRGKAPSKH